MRSLRAYYLVSLSLACLLSACGGGGSASPSFPSATVTLTGRVSFDRVPFKTLPQQGLDFAAVVDAPARGVVVEAVETSSSSILASVSTDANGNYSLVVPGSRTMFVRAKAQMLSTGVGATWNFRVVNNTNGNALYALDGQSFDSGTTNSTHDLRATSGWQGTGYVNARLAAPFAILDTAYQAKELLLSAQSNLQMPALDMFWSTTNRPASPFCPSIGNIVSTGFQTTGFNDCATVGTSPGGIYIQGDFSNGLGDTDEFDQSVIAHEIGHYVEGSIGRSDSVGGSHRANDRLDMRVAFSEGWGNAFASMVLGTPIYRDSIGVNSENNSDIENGVDVNAGWYSEATVQQVLWDIFDTPADAGDGLALGFTPIFQVFVGPLKSTAALTDIHSFITGLKAIQPGSASALDALLMTGARNITALDDFASGEANSGGLAGVLPIYIPLTLNQAPVRVCSSAAFGRYNRLGNRKFFRLDLNSPALVSITVTAEADPAQNTSLAAVDPDAKLWRQGVLIWNGGSVSTLTPPVEQSPALSLSGGTHVLEVYDYLYVDPASSTITSTPRCMKVTATG